MSIEPDNILWWWQQDELEREGTPKLVRSDEERAENLEAEDE